MSKEKMNSTVMYLNDETISSLNEQYEFPEGCLVVGPLRTPIRVEKRVFQKIIELEILPGTESFNIERILLGCVGLKMLHLANMEKEGIARIFKGKSGLKDNIWNNLTCLEILTTNPSPLFINTVGIIKCKRFPCLNELKHTCRVPHRTKLDVYIESYMDIHQFISTNRKSLRKIMMNHDLVFDMNSPPFGFYSAEAKHYPYSESKAKVLKRLKEDLSFLKLEEFRVQFSPIESSLEWLKPRGDLDIGIVKYINNLTEADLDWSNTTFWSDKEKDLQIFLENNADTLLKLRVRMTYCQDGYFDCSVLQCCSNLAWLVVESVWCKVKNVQCVPTSLKILELRLPMKPAQRTWISNNLTKLEALTIEQNFQEDDPVLPLLRLPKLKKLTVVYCSTKRVEELNAFCLNHAGLVLYEREDIPLKYNNISDEYLDITITIDPLKYFHKRSFEIEETGKKGIEQKIVVIL